MSCTYDNEVRMGNYKTRERISYRESLLRNKASLDFAAAAGDKTYEFTTPIPPPPKARSVRRPYDGQPVVPLEKEIQKAILQRIALRKDVVFVGRFNRGQALASYNGETRYTPFNSVPGFPDIHGLLVGGRAFYIEVKRPPPHYEKPSKEQQAFLDAARVGGACAGVACSVEEAMGLLP